MKLTAKDYYKANDPVYLSENPEAKEMLFKIQRNCKPTWCGICYFGKQQFDDQLYYKGVTCALDMSIHCPEYEGRADGCPLEKGANNG